MSASPPPSEFSAGARTDYQRKVLAAWEDTGRNNSAAARILGIHRSTLRTIIARIKQRAREAQAKGLEQEAWDDKDKNGGASGTAKAKVGFEQAAGKGDVKFSYDGPLDRPMPIEELLEINGVSLETLQIEKVKVSAWGVTAKIKEYQETTGRDGQPWTVPTKQYLQAAKNYGIQVWLKDRETDPGAAFDAAVDRLVDKIRECPPPPKWNAQVMTGAFIAEAEKRMLEISITDLHVGKLARSNITGLHDWDSKIASSACLQAARYLLEWGAIRGFGQIVLPVGNDFFHTDTVRQNTTDGDHTLHTDVLWQDEFDIGCDVAIDLLDLCRQYAPVYAPWVPGNHDKQRSKAMTRVLHERYRNDDTVEVDNGSDKFKAYRWGTNLLGYCHGKDEPFQKLPLEMSTRWPKDFAECRWKEWHVGHGHRMKNCGLVVDGFEDQSLRVRMLPSLCASDEWHSDNCYHNLRSAEAYVWHQETAYDGHKPFNLDFVQ